jgi:hypothetical protein
MEALAAMVLMAAQVEVAAFIMFIPQQTAVFPVAVLAVHQELLVVVAAVALIAVLFLLVAHMPVPYLQLLLAQAATMAQMGTVVILAQMVSASLLGIKKPQPDRTGWGK